MNPHSSTTAAIEQGLMLPPVLNTVQAAEFLGVAENTLRYWRHFGRGPKSYNVGRTVRYDLDELKKWQDAQRANAVGDDV